MDDSQRIRIPGHLHLTIGLPFRACASLFIALMGLSATAIADPSAQAKPLLFRSSDREVHFTTDFPGGKIDALQETDHNEFEMVIRPEHEPINDSAWYAFRVEADTKREIEIHLRYEGGSHRYEPKISRDRVTWEAVPHWVVSRHPGGRSVTMRFPVSKEPLWVAGQELICNQELEKWTTTLAKKPFVQLDIIGESVKQRPVERLIIDENQCKDSIFILSRQHPPEVTGTIGMVHFVNAISSDTDLCKRFRKHFKVVVVPIANPDGVAQGYWRANANGVDLNRDWMRFTQPETKAIHDTLIQLHTEEQGKLWLFLDFHSTYDEVFYTPPRETKLFPVGFTAQWLQRMNQRVPGFKMLRDDEHNEHRSTSKSWVSRELGIHAITYEFGDETDRDRIHEIATSSAEEMMKLLLERKEQQN